MIPLVDLQAQYQSIRREIDAAIAQTVESGRFVMGKQVAEFEKQFAAFCGSRECVALASGTAALQLALQAAGIGKGDEVITTPHTFMATAEAVLMTGAEFAFADVEEETQNIDPEKIAAAMTERTKAIIPVHLFGQSCDMDAIQKIAAEHNLTVIEDAAQAHGAEYRGKRLPVSGIGCFSFYPAKILGAYGDAGAIAADNEEVAATARMLRDHGRKPGSKYEHAISGSGERMDELQAAVLSAKLPYLEQWVKRRREIARQYSEELEGIVITPTEKNYGRHAYYVYTIRSRKRDALQRHLKEKGVASQVYYPIPLHLQPAYHRYGHKKGDFPEAEKLAGENLSLPLYPEMTDEQISTVTAAVRSFR